MFGNVMGKRVTSIRTAWENAREAAGLTGFQLRDLRHEAASRFEEAGVLTTDVSKFLDSCPKADPSTRLAQDIGGRFF